MCIYFMFKNVEKLYKWLIVNYFCKFFLSFICNHIYSNIAVFCYFGISKEKWNMFSLFGSFPALLTAMWLFYINSKQTPISPPLGRQSSLIDRQGNVCIVLVLTLHFWTFDSWLIVIVSFINFWIQTMYTKIKL